MKKRTYSQILPICLALFLVFTILYSSGCSKSSEDESSTTSESGSGVVVTHDTGQSVSVGADSAAVPSVNAGGSGPSSADSIGLSTGGAKDIENFRENIKNGYLPLPTDITYEGLFYDYYFDTGETETCNKLFCPSYSYAITDDPYSGKTEYYLSVGLNSGLKESDFERKKLNLVVVLDVSGSMKSPFDSYYYDKYGNLQNNPDADMRKEKINIATESIVAMLDHLNDDDLFGLVVFNKNARLEQNLIPVDTSNPDALKDQILDITAYGSTHLSAGMDMATDLFDELKNVDPYEYENRIIFLTDAMPNTGDTSTSGLMNIVSTNADNNIFTTFIGIGVDFNSELVEQLSKIRGSNYYSVHSSEQFRERMDEEFEYMVTPLVFDLKLKMYAEGWEIKKVYGSPEADEATGTIMNVNTLFPSSKVDGETRGGLILLKLEENGEGGPIRLVTSYEDRNGEVDSSDVVFEIAEETPEYFENTGIRKGILLSRYADLLKGWLIDERSHYNTSYVWEPKIDSETGIIIPAENGQWERQSMSLTVSDAYQKLFGFFSRYFENEIESIGDDTLANELNLLELLINHQ